MKNKLLIVLLVIIIVFLAYLAFKPKSVIAPIEQEQVNKQTEEVKNSTDNAEQNSTELSQYNKNGLSFYYNKDATEKTLTGTFGPYHRIGITGGDYPDTLAFFQGVVPDEANGCNDLNIKTFGIKMKTTIINRKSFSYCDNSQGEPIRVYIYKKDGKTVIINVPQATSKPETGYIDLGSIEMSSATTSTQSTWLKSPQFGLYYEKGMSPIECYENQGGEPIGSCNNSSYIPKEGDQPEFRILIDNDQGGTEIIWGGYSHSYLQNICINNKFTYGVSDTACVRGKVAVLVHASARATTTTAELKIFGDFVLKNK